MNAKRSARIALVFVLLASTTLLSFWPAATSASPAPSALSSRLLQPPPPPPPPPPSEGQTPLPPSQEPAPPAQSEEPTPPAQPQEAETPPKPFRVPQGVEPLPDPEVTPPARAYALVPAGTALEVIVDRGCGSQYQVGEPIDFIAIRGDDVTAGYWQYLEVWSSTNQQWWHKLISGRWVEPQETISRSAWIAEPTGAEQLYARLIDQFGNVIEEAWCNFTSGSGPGPGPTPWAISCNQSETRDLNINDEDTWFFDGIAGQQVTISLQGSNGLDTYLELHRPNGSLLAKNDDRNAPWDLNSTIQRRLWNTGTYTIVARGFKYQAGQYRLTVSCQ